MSEPKKPLLSGNAQAIGLFTLGLVILTVQFAPLLRPIMRFDGDVSRFFACLFVVGFSAIGVAYSLNGLGVQPVKASLTTLALLLNAVLLVLSLILALALLFAGAGV